MYVSLIVMEKSESTVRKVRRGLISVGGGGGRGYDWGRYFFLLQVVWPPAGYLGH